MLGWWGLYPVVYCPSLATHVNDDITQPSWARLHPPLDQRKNHPDANLFAMYPARLQRLSHMAPFVDEGGAIACETRGMVLSDCLTCPAYLEKKG